MIVALHLAIIDVYVTLGRLILYWVFHFTLDYCLVSLTDVDIVWCNTNCSERMEQLFMQNVPY